MPGEKDKRSRVELCVEIAMQSNQIDKNMKIFSKLFSEFSKEWLLGVEANYKEFLNYVLCSMKKHEENKKSS